MARRRRDRVGRNEARQLQLPASLLPTLGALLLFTAATASRGQWEPPRRLTRDLARSETSINFARSAAADDDGGVHLVWADQRHGENDIYYKRSPDGGVSWGPAMRLTRDPAASNNPSIAVAGDDVHVVWWDTRASGLHQIYHKRSRDRGLSWSETQPVSSSPGGGAHASLAMWRSTLHVVYVDGRDGNAEVYYVRSLDGGRTWEAAVRLSSLPHSSYTPTVAAWGTSVYAAWTDTRHGGRPDGLEEEYFRRSTDGGRTWQPEQRLTDDPANSWAPSLAAYRNHVWIVWFDERGGDWEVYLKRSEDSGESWSQDRRLTRAAGASQRPSISRHGSDLYVAWWDTRDGDEEVYLLHSSSLGETWGEAQRITDNPGASALVSVAAAASGVHLVWTDSRAGNAEIYYRRLPGEPVTVRNGRIAFNRRVGGEPQIFTVAPDGSDLRRLTSEGRNSYPAYSKDGSRLAFVSDRRGEEEIWVMDDDGSDARAVTAVERGGDFVPAWSYDGTRIAYASVRPEVGHPEVWVVDADGSDPHRLTFTPKSPLGPTWSLHPTWEPRDERIYYASTASGTSQIWGMLAIGLGQEQKTHGLAPGAPHANVPEFSRDGSLVLWAGFEQQFGEVWSWPMSAGEGPRRLTVTSDPRNSDNPAWSPDGTKILFDSNRGGEVEIWVMGADGSNPAPLIADAFGQTSWQPLFGAQASTPAAPSELEASVESPNEITLRWTDNSENETGFVVELAKAGETLAAWTTVPEDTVELLAQGLEPSSFYTFRVRAEGDHGFSAYSNEASATTLGETVGCTTTDHLACLGDQRFAVGAVWRDPRSLRSGPGFARLMTADTTSFWFFQPDNVELVLKVLDGRAVNGSFWVLYGALSDVEYWITITDTQTGATRTYYNPPLHQTGVSDTEAF